MLEGADVTAPIVYRGKASRLQHELGRAGGTARQGRRSQPLLRKRQVRRVRPPNRDRRREDGGTGDGNLRAHKPRDRAFNAPLPDRAPDADFADPRVRPGTGAQALAGCRLSSAGCRLGAVSALRPFPSHAAPRHVGSISCPISLSSGRDENGALSLRIQISHANAAASV